MVVTSDKGVITLIRRQINIGYVAANFLCLKSCGVAKWYWKQRYD